MGWGRKLAVRGIAVGVPLLVAFGGLEVVTRLQSARRRAVWLARQGELCTRPSADRDRVYEYVPLRCDTSSRGLPDVERAIPKPAGTTRIVVVGDSVAEGIHVPRARRFAPLLEASLNARPGSPRIEVPVVAISGYSTGQELAMAPEIRALEPDLVLWIYCLNDPAHPFFDDASASVNQFHDHPRSHALRWLGATAHRLRRRYFAARGWCLDRHADGLANWIEALHCWDWPDVAANLRRIAQVGGPGVPVVFAVFPLIPTDTWDGYFADPITGKLLAEARTDGMLALDLKEAFLGQPPAKAALPDDPWHASEAGHAMLATHLEARLRGLGLVPTAPTP